MGRRTPPVPIRYRLTRDEHIALMKQWEAFIIKIAKGWQASYPQVTLEEFRAAVTEGFWEAGLRFDKRKKVQFSTYAKLWGDKACRELTITLFGHGIGRTQWRDERYRPKT